MCNLLVRYFYVIGRWIFMHFKKTVVRFLFIFTFFIFLVMGVNDVNAATYTANVKNVFCSSTYNYSLYKKYAFIGTGSDARRRFTLQYSSSPKKMIYCLEKGVTLYEGKKKYTSVAKVSDSTKSGNIAKAIAYGSNSTSNVSSCTSKRIATQMLVHMISKGYTSNGKLVWKNITNSGVRSIVSSGSKASIASNYISIRNKILHHDSMPFSGIASSTKTTAQSNAKYFKYNTTNKNFELSLSDSLLSESWGWTIYSKDSGITSASISGGKLTVKADTSTRGKNVCVRIRKTIATGTLYKSTATNQDTALLLNESSTYKYTYVCFKSSYGQVKKVDAANTSKVLSGAKFKLYTDASCTTAAKDIHGTSLTSNVSTDSSGYAYFYNIKNGTYYVKETQSPSKYVLDSNSCRKITISSDQGSVTFQNEKITSTSIQVFKNDKYDRSGIKGVKIGLYQDDKCSIVSTLVPSGTQIKTTDDSGMVLWNDIDTTGIHTFPHLLYVKEEKTSIPAGYIQEKENECKKVEISESDLVDGTVAQAVQNSVTIYNIPYGNLKILKIDEEKREPLSGVTFKLLDENKKPAVDKNGKVVEEITTGQDGTAVFKNILYGIYYIKETKSNLNYKFIDEYHMFELNKNTDSIKLAKLGELPYTIGDVNINNAVDADDLTELSNMLKDEKNLIGLEKKKQASSDINNDGVIDENDKKILDYYLSNKDDINLYTNSIKILCDGKTECALDIKLLKNISVIAKMNDSGANLVCYEPVSPETPDTDQSDNEQPDNDLQYSGTPVTEDTEVVIPTCKFTEKSLDYLNQAIENNQASTLNADFNGDSKINKDDSKILAAYLSYESENKLSAINNYVTSVEKIGVLDTSTLEIINKIGTIGIIPSQEVHASLVITNIPIDMKISKHDMTNEKEIKGAKIVIEDSKGDVFLEFTSGTTAKEFRIPAGIYTLTEVVAPASYQEFSSKIKFRVGADGNVKLLSAESEYYDVVASEEENDTDLDHLKIYNKPIRERIIQVPDTGSSASIATAIIGFLMIATGGYFIYKKYQIK